MFIEPSDIDKNKWWCPGLWMWWVWLQIVTLLLILWHNCVHRTNVGTNRRCQNFRLLRSEDAHLFLETEFNSGHFNRIHLFLRWYTYLFDQQLGSIPLLTPFQLLPLARPMLLSTPFYWNLSSLPRPCSMHVATEFSVQFCRARRMCSRHQFQ